MNLTAPEDRTCVTCSERPTVAVSVAGVSTRLAMCGTHGSGMLSDGIAREVQPLEVIDTEAPSILYGRVGDR